MLCLAITGAEKPNDIREAIAHLQATADGTLSPRIRAKVGATVVRLRELL